MITILLSILGMALCVGGAVVLILILCGFGVIAWTVGKVLIALGLVALGIKLLKSLFKSI